MRFSPLKQGGNTPVEPAVSNEPVQQQAQQAPTADPDDMGF